MGSMEPSMKNVMGKNLGLSPTANVAPPVVQQTQPQVQQSQGPQQSGGLDMSAVLRSLMNQMMGIRGGGGARRPQPRPQTTSPRNTLIQSLMGGGFGR